MLQLIPTFPLHPLELRGVFTYFLLTVCTVCTHHIKIYVAIVNFLKTKYLYKNNLSAHQYIHTTKKVIICH